MLNIELAKKYPISILAPKGSSTVSIEQPLSNAKSGFSIMEIWKDIKNYEGCYQVSNDGKIKTVSRLIKRKNKGDFILKSRILKQLKNNKGYFNIRLCFNNIKKSFTVHRLVANAFIINFKNKPQINHINCIKSDNRIENLEWVTNDENQHHAKINGTRKGITAGEKNGRAILTEKEVKHIRENSKKWGAKLKLAKKFNVSKGCIYHICSNKNWKHI